LQDVHREGITGVTAADVAAARESAAVVKLLAIAERTAGADGEAVCVRVHPAMIPRTHPLANVRGAFNAVFVEAAAAGQLMFYGQGAGGQPTASAVLGDLVSVARHRVAGGHGPRESSHADLRTRPMGEVLTRYHIRLDVDDKPGVLARVAQVFAEHEVSIETVRQTLIGDGGSTTRAALVIVTHTAPDAALSATVAALADLDVVDAVASVLRVEGE
jgi:homoserine dehydrogenase